MPAEAFTDQDIDAMIEEAKKDGSSEIIKNKDGSVTIKMEKEAYDELLSEMKEGIQSLLDDIKTGQDYQSIKDVKYNSALTDFTVVVDKTAFENSVTDSFVVISLAGMAASYQILEGKNYDSIKIVFNFQDATTKEMFDKFTFPDDFADLENGTESGIE